MVGFFFRFDSECLMRFILTVRKNYRNVPYHNWSHAFSVAHAIYTVIKQTKHQFTPNDVGFIFKMIDKEKYYVLNFNDY